MIILVALEDELTKEDLNGLQIEYMGVGKINAAIKTTEVIRNHSPELIINYGTAGSLNKDISGLDLSQFSNLLCYQIHLHLL